MNIAYCTSCGDEFIQKTITHSTCPKKECRHKYAEDKKKTNFFISQIEFHKKNKQKTETERAKTTVVKNAIIQEMKDKNGFQYCEVCNTGNYYKELELHHIIFRSEIPSHPKKHSKINSILICHEHHEWFHAQKNRRDYLIRERKLWEIFPETIRKEFYQQTK